MPLEDSPKSLKRVIISLTLAILLLTSVLAPSIYYAVTAFRLNVATASPLTLEEKLEDFAFLYETIRDNYPFLDVNKRLHGIDWLANQTAYQEQIETTHLRGGSFARDIQLILSDLNNGHTHLLADRSTIEQFRSIYAISKEYGYWQTINFEVLNHPLVLSQYGLEPYVFSSTTSDTASSTEPLDRAIHNASVQDLIPERIGLITVPSMIQGYELAYDRELITTYLQQAKNYQALIIDIRGNGGGNSNYWQTFLLPLIVNQPYTVTNYSFYKAGDFIQKYFKARKGRANSLAKLDSTALPMLPSEVLTDFSYFDDFTLSVLPDEASIYFKGNLYLLVDQGVYSSSEMLAMFAKDSGALTLIGSQTGGDGIGSDPLLAMLPNSGYVFRFSKELGTVADGTCNEEYKTIPDYIVDTTRTANPLDDPCIQQVLLLESIMLDTACH